MTPRPDHTLRKHALHLPLDDKFWPVYTGDVPTDRRKDIIESSKGKLKDEDNSIYNQNSMTQK